MIEMKAILVIFMALVISVSSEDGLALDSFCSENNFTLVFAYKNVTLISFIKFINESKEQRWDFYYNKSFDVPVYELGAIYLQDKRYSQAMRNKENILKYSLPLHHPCIYQMMCYGSNQWTDWQIFFKDCPKYHIKREETKNISTPEVQYVGAFWLETNPEDVYVVGQDISQRDSNQKQVVYRLSNHMNSFDSTDKRVTQFFGCPIVDDPTPKTSKDGFPLWAIIVIVIVIVLIAILLVSAVIGIYNKFWATKPSYQSVSTVQTVDSDTGKPIREKKRSPN